jgi:ADP-heptose:LPS heptosyltransferase
MELFSSSEGDRKSGISGQVGLAVRLSSLGDVILSTSVLSVRNPGELTHLPQQWDWIVAREFASLLRGHPQIRTLIEYDRSTGLQGWLAVIRQVRSRSHEYALAVDLHASLRSRLLRWLTVDRLHWRVFPKERWRIEGFFLFKSLWPRSLRPRAVVARSKGLLQRAPSSAPLEGPTLRHLLLEQNAAEEAFLAGSLALAPGSLWQGKEWSNEGFALVIQELTRHGIEVVLLGSKGDRAARALAERFAGEARVKNRVGTLDLPEVARELARSTVLLGNDSGLAHLAESVGTPVVTLFGPTSPSQGFGPLHPRSRAVESPLWCRPCSKGGERCFRKGSRRYQCMRAITPDQVMAILHDFFPQLDSSSRTDRHPSRDSFVPHPGVSQ